MEGWLTIEIAGLTCADSAVIAVEALKAVPDVALVSCDHETSRAFIRPRSGCDVAALCAGVLSAIRAVGHDAAILGGA